MVFHLVRHAEAIERTPDVPDEQRQLTSRGRTRFRKIATTLKKADMEPDVILTSPLIRAVQTAEILAQALKFTGELAVTPLLAHGFQKTQLDELLRRYPKAKEIALVGHEPELGELASLLFAIDDPVNLDKGAALAFKRARSGGAEFRQLVDGGAKLIKSRAKALKRLTNG